MYRRSGQALDLSELAARLGRNGRAFLGQLLHEQDVAIVPFGEDHWRVAAEACARSLAGEPPLAVGRDVAHAGFELASSPVTRPGRGPEGPRRTEGRATPRRRRPGQNAVIATPAWQSGHSSAG
jgi:hypothetical protein